MNTDQLEGESRNLAGRAQQAYGEATDDHSVEAEGRVRSAAGRAQAQYGEAMESAREYTADRPFNALAIAAGVGFVFGLLVGRS